MAELKRTHETDIYSNIIEGEIFPLIIRYSDQDSQYNNKNNASTSFNEMISQVSGCHTCYFIHRQQKNKRTNKVYDELVIKFGELPIHITSKSHNDGYTIMYPHFIEKNLVLPEEESEYVKKECNVKFVDLHEDLFKLIQNEDVYWRGHATEISQFLTDCFSLPIPPIEIQIEEDKEMWQAYLDGSNAILESKRELIKIKKVIKQTGDLLKLEFDMSSDAINFRNAISDELDGKCDKDANISIKNGECIISFDSYQSIPKDSIDNIKLIGKEYCYKSISEPENRVIGKITIMSDPDELFEIVSLIEKELADFSILFTKGEDGIFQLNSDKDFDCLLKIVETHYKGIAEARNTTKIVVPLLPPPNCINIDDVKATMPKGCKITLYGKHYIVSSQKPLNTQSQIFSLLKLTSCNVSIAPTQIDERIEIKDATIKDGAYKCIFNNKSELYKLGGLFNEITSKYKEQYIRSTYQYAFTPQIDNDVLAKLKLNNYGKDDIKVDIPKSCVIFHPKSLEDYNRLKEDFRAQLNEAIVIGYIPDYIPISEVVLLSDDIEYRRDIFEKINIALAEVRNNFILYKINQDKKELEFEFKFDNIEERDNIKNNIECLLSSINIARIQYTNNKGLTQWSISEDLSLLKDLEQKLQSDFRNETVNLLNGSKYDKLCKVDQSGFTNNHQNYEIKKFIIENSKTLGECTSRKRDYAIIKLENDIIEGLSHNEFEISAGDYIQFPSIGKATELLRQKKAMLRILRPGSNNNPYPINRSLPDFIFDPKYASETVVNINDAKEDMRSHGIGNLNEKQFESVVKSVLAKDLALIQGPPGTGKTTVIAEIILQEIRRKPDCRILLTSQTNLAVDNALERLQGQAGIRPVRIGKPDKLEPEGRRFSLDIIKKWTCDEKNEDDNAVKIWIDRISNKSSTDSRYNQAISAWKSELDNKDKHSRLEFSELYKRNANLIAATCSICGSNDFKESYSDMFGGSEHDMFFDVVIMDEASKATPLEMAVPLVLGKKIIIIGDHKQLPPMMDDDTIDRALEKIGKKELAEKLQKAESQFKRLFEAAAKVRKTIVATLDTQYRMHEQIMNTIKQFYEDELADQGGLKCGIIDTMDIQDINHKGSRWHGISIAPIIRPETHAVWIDVKTPETNLQPGFKNAGELAAIDLVLKAFKQDDSFNEFMNAQTKPEDKEIGIITFYSAQSREIKKKYQDQNFRIDVVDRFQGMERNIIIVSTVRSNTKYNIGFAKEIERINVAFSRARCLLIVVGNKQQFERHSSYAASIAKMETINFEQLKDSIR